MRTFTVTYTIKYELSFSPNYVWTNDDLCFNLKTNRRIKQVYNNGCIGYSINGKFKSLKHLKKHMVKPKKTTFPF